MVTRGDVARWGTQDRPAVALEGPPDPVAIRHRLITMRKSIGQLKSYGPIDPDLLTEKPAAGLVAERIMFFLTDLAYEINCGLVRVPINRSPQSVLDSTEASFAAVVRAGIIDTDLAARLHPEDGPHHILLQLNLDADPGVVEDGVRDALAAFDDYIRVVDQWLPAEEPTA